MVEAKYYLIFATNWSEKIGGFFSDKLESELFPMIEKYRDNEDVKSIMLIDVEEKAVQILKGRDDDIKKYFHLKVNEILGTYNWFVRDIIPSIRLRRPLHVL